MTYRWTKDEMLTIRNMSASTWYSYTAPTLTTASTLPSAGGTYINRGGQWVPVGGGGGTTGMQSGQMHFLLMHLGFKVYQQSLTQICYRYQDDAEYSITLNHPNHDTHWRDEDIRLMMDYAYKIIASYERKHLDDAAPPPRPVLTELDAEEW